MPANSIFTEAWWTTLVIYAAIYFLARYAVYNLIFASFVGSPQSFSFRDLIFWRRKVSFFSAVIFAPLFEEFLFTYLAYASFLQYARDGKEWLVILMVASFFALLHLPGDIRQQYYSRRGLQPHYLLLWQFNRFYFSLAAYFIFISTGSLWPSIVLHYIANGLVSIYNFDLEEGTRQWGSIDLVEGSIILLELGIVVFACSQYYFYYPPQGKYLLAIGVMITLRWIYLLTRVRRVASSRFIS